MADAYVVLTEATVGKLNECADTPRWCWLRRRRLWREWVLLNNAFQAADTPPEPRWKVMRFECPARDCSRVAELADHHRRDPETVTVVCPCHGRMECVAEEPLRALRARRPASTPNQGSDR